MRMRGWVVVLFVQPKVLDSARAKLLSAMATDLAAIATAIGATADEEPLVAELEQFAKRGVPAGLARLAGHMPHCPPMIELFRKATSDGWQFYPPLERPPAGTAPRASAPPAPRAPPPHPLPAQPTAAAGG